MIIKIEIKNDLYADLIIKVDDKNKYISFMDKHDTSTHIPIDISSIHSLISCLKIIYRELFNIDYPNKSE